MYKKLNSISVMFLIIIAMIALFSENAFSQHNHGNDSKKDTSTTTAIDPVCKTSVMKNDTLSVKYNNIAYFFCTDRDMKTFIREPQKFIPENQEKQEHEHGMMGMSTTMLLMMGGMMAVGMIAVMIIKK